MPSEIFLLDISGLQQINRVQKPVYLARQVQSLHHELNISARNATYKSSWRLMWSCIIEATENPCDDKIFLVLEKYLVRHNLQFAVWQ